MKKLSLVLSAVLLTVGLTGCAGEKAQSTEAKNDTQSKKEIVVGASPVPHKEILEKAAEVLKKDGYTLKIVDFTDYQIPNTALAEKQLDANYFQHIPFLNKSVEEKKLDLDYTVKVHIEPMGLYSKKIKNIKEIKDGAEIAIPNDPTNGGRALRVLESAGLIKLKSGELVTKLDITENKKGLKITEMDAPQLPRVLGDVDAAVINTNFAIEAGLNPTKDAIVLEPKESPYANVLAVRKEDKDKDYIKALSKALNSPEVKKFIEEKYKGNIIPAF
ncbi:D-methionine transport system substrate-binding protein [Clostridium tetanomorphum]|uniref:Lipoprotein n=1 Tax=Clostridium tetanomorphum TaxID=1553 RepID=A0A923EAD7_CLOTT|nr:MetQ/NlpA family ABC transporter substrate-binding protein [Clostridium tetanomorphum]KAJ52630.1 ABC transporter substrate binding protein [Clostridium tetanomorphum DSM 665]MBC2396815.1 MetQ/NlpA family ABC transporter substrate-binding protein [Clostridium tetanomorphum]MBP1863223.1 D-methionine transport system substrate-binding protein [Clostridium tetanomorphum]NRS84331.1 D-methionine transport system substrate-binding protein [Clostridium tetanomorphum]NRZ97545.1 D-methionine transpor